MAVFKCKMCGGTIEFEEGATVGVCDSCGTKQTLPRLNDDKKANLYDRANHFRRSNDFDKAMSLYEQILNEDASDAEAYWSLVLCRYGIEYVEDPASHKHVPTVNRAQYTSIFADEDYKAALEYADTAQKTIYKEEAKAIDEIQKGILEVSRKEKPFDVFICYKETDQNGERTKDSVLANDLYHELTEEGFKVFYAAITLEDKLGTAYEPYIFAALNSAKVMVVIGTKPEYFNAVWVRNEWSRFLSLIKKGERKTLIPAYRDMDPYDLPEEFSHLQAQDMNKLGFMQDLTRGIRKLTGRDRQAETYQAPAARSMPIANAETVPLLKRAHLFLEDSDFTSADAYCEKVLDMDPENGEAYLVKLLCAFNVTKEEALGDLDKPLDRAREFKNAVRFSDEATAARLNAYKDQSVKNYTVKQEKLAELEKKRLEEERVRAENERREREARAAAERKRQEKQREIQTARNAQQNAQSYLNSKVNEKKRYEEQIAANQRLLDDYKKNKKKINLYAALVMLLPVLLIISAVIFDQNEQTFWAFVVLISLIARIVFSWKLLKMINVKPWISLLDIFTYFILMYVMSIIALLKGSKGKTKQLRDENNSLKTKAASIDAEIERSRGALLAINEKLAALEKENGGN